MCGPLEVEIGGRRLESELPGRKGQLLAYLAVNRQRAVRREELIDALWPTNPPLRPEAAFATLLTRTRASVGHATISGSSHLRLELGDGASIDWEVAQAAADAARARLTGRDPAGAVASADEGLAIIARGFLQDHEAAWIDDRRRELDELRAPLAEVLARAALALGGEHLAAAERAARTMIEQNPFRETGYAVLMEVLAAGGNEAEAMRTYDRLRALLREHLGLTPSPAVTALAERVLRHQSDDTAISVAGPDGGGVAAPGELRPVLPGMVATVADRPLVDRTSERNRLLRVAEDAAAGHRRVMLISGEPGIGKTRLAVCVASILNQHSWSVLYGRADRESVLTYQPVIEALQHYLADGVSIDPHVLELLGPELAALSRMVPALRALSSAPADSGGAEPELERFRVFEAVAALIASATARCPALLILDDLHWADRSTMSLLRHLIRATVDCRLFVLGTFRDPHEEIEAPFREFVDELWREGLLEQLDLDGLAREDTAELVREHAPDAEDGLIARLYERTDGNPFYVEETLRGLEGAAGDASGRLGSDPGFAVPDQVKRMIKWRVERLEPPAPAILKAAAVLGPEFELGLASATSGVSMGDALGALTVAHGAGLIVADPGRPDRSAFRHALVREALYEALPASERARLHLAAGRELERAGRGRARAAELAMHYSHAIHIGGTEAAVRWRLEAAAQATFRHAHEESVEHHRRALEALDAMAPDDRRRASILLGQGQALLRAGEVEEGRRRLFEAAGLARKYGAADILAECALDSGSFYLSGGDVDTELAALLEEALEGLDAPEDRPSRARVMARLSVALYWEPPSRARSRQLADDAMRLAQADGDPLAVAWASGSHHCANWVSERPAALLAEAERTVELAEQARDEELELIARTWRVNHLLSLGRIPEVDEEIERFVGLADRLKQSRYRWYAPLFQAVRSMMDAQLEEAEQHVMTMAERGGRVHGSPAPLLAAAQLFFVRALQGRLDELEGAVAAFIESYPGVPAWRCGMAFLQSQLGRHDQARSMIDELASDGFGQIRHDNLWLLSVSMLAETCAVSGADHAAELERLLKPCAGVFVVSPTAAWLGPVDRFLGLLAAAQGRLDEADACLIRAVELCESTRAASILALVRLDHAEMLLARNRDRDVERARALARAALSTGEAAGMRHATRRALSILSDSDSTVAPAASALGGTVAAG